MVRFWIEIVCVKKKKKESKVKKNVCGDFPGGPVVKILHLHSRGHGFNFDGQGTGIRHEREIKDDSKVFNLRNGVTTY